MTNPTFAERSDRIHLNPEQRRAAAHVTGAMLVLAGPGSGKTAVLTERIAAMIERAEIPPEEILVLTFSNKAAQEMQNRFRKRSGGRKPPVTFGTFHSVFYAILRVHSTEELRLAQPDARIGILQEIGRRLSIQGCDHKGCTDLIDAISLYKNTGKIAMYLRGEIRTKFALILEAYEQSMREQGFLDFDDMILRCYELFTRRQEILNDWRNRFRYLLIDEFQDCNMIQYDLVKLLAGEQRNLFAVGDDDQSIYGFRGADSRVVLRFMQDYPEAEQVHLLRNYRCGRRIIEKADQLIQNNRIRAWKPRQLPSKFRGEGTVILIQCRDSYEEAELVLHELEKLRAEQKRTETEQTETMRVAILYRSGQCASYLADLLESQWEQRDDGIHLVLQTIHASKGLEYDTVFVIGLQEGLLPSNRAVSEEEREEERRLLYVAMTRARNRLYLFARGHEKYGKRISSFLYEMDHQCK